MGGQAGRAKEIVFLIWHPLGKIDPQAQARYNKRQAAFPVSANYTNLGIRCEQRPAKADARLPALVAVSKSYDAVKINPRALSARATRLETTLTEWSELA